MNRNLMRNTVTLLFALALVGGNLWMSPTAAQQGSPPGGGPFDTGGRDDKPAAEVFKNITQFKNLPAGRLGGIMQTWTRVLGVKCNHCHVPGAFEKEDLPAKQIARDMVAMTQKLNNESLKAIKNLKSERPSVSCYTCHRGQAKPDTTPPAPAAQPAPPKE